MSDLLSLPLTSKEEHDDLNLTCHDRAWQREERNRFVMNPGYVMDPSPIWRFSFTENKLGGALEVDGLLLVPVEYFLFPFPRLSFRCCSDSTMAEREINCLMYSLRYFDCSATYLVTMFAMTRSSTVTISVNCSTRCPPKRPLSN